MLQIGRKSLLLVGTVVLGILLVTTGTLVQLFNLEEEDLNETQRIIGYLVIIMVCLLMSVYVVSLG